MPKQATIVICEGRGEGAAPRKLEQDLATALSGWPEVDVAVLPHLYDLAPDGAGMQYLRSVEGDMIVLCRLYPRAAFWVLDANRVKGRLGRSSFLPDEEMEPAGSAPGRRRDEPPRRTIWCLDLRVREAVEPFVEEVTRILEELEEILDRPIAVPEGGAVADTARAVRVEERTRSRWYPVVDYGRCGSCLECLNFCLFGVFGIDESERLLVEQPDACRDGCPACSRVCPSRAIMFPAHHDPAIAGDPGAPEAALDLGLVQLSGLTVPRDMAEEERRRAMAEKPAETNAVEEREDATAAERDELDRLVDDLDQLDL